MDLAGEYSQMFDDCVPARGLDHIAIEIRTSVMITIAIHIGVISFGAVEVSNSSMR
jgi:hypothetical protein